MHIVITGGAGFLGSRLARQLLQRGTLTGRDGQAQEIKRITLLDVVPAQGSMIRASKPSPATSPTLP
jgi:nucleoside-diphosphate-sugar epimerase